MSNGYLTSTFGKNNPLRLNVVNGTTQPTTPANNTLWVNTSTDISNVYLQNDQPTDTTAGNLWLLSNTPSITNANPNCYLDVFQGDISVRQYPYLAYQYSGSTWVRLSTSAGFKVYRDGTWYAPFTTSSTYVGYWYWQKYATVATKPYPSSFNGYTQTASAYYYDNNLSISMNIADSYSAMCTTYLFCEADTSLSITFTTDDAGTVTINGSTVGTLASCTATAYTCKFNRGWNKLVVCYTEGSGGDGWTTSPRLYNNSAFNGMNAVIN